MQVSPGFSPGLSCVVPVVCHFGLLQPHEVEAPHGTLSTWSLPQSRRYVHGWECLQSGHVQRSDLRKRFVHGYAYLGWRGRRIREI